MSSNGLDAARAILATVTSQDTAAADAGLRLSELGLDSLDRVLLAVLIEQQTGRPVADEVLAAVVTVGDIALQIEGQEADVD